MFNIMKITHIHPKLASLSLITCKIKEKNPESRYIWIRMLKQHCFTILQRINRLLLRTDCIPLPYTIHLIELTRHQKEVLDMCAYIYEEEEKKKNETTKIRFHVCKMVLWCEICSLKCWQNLKVPSFMEHKMIESQAQILLCIRKWMKGVSHCFIYFW